MTSEVYSGPFQSFCFGGLILVSQFALTKALQKFNEKLGPGFLKTFFHIVTLHSKTESIFLNIIAYFFHVFPWSHIKNVLFLFSGSKRLPTSQDVSQHEHTYLPFSSLEPNVDLVSGTH